MVDADPLLMIVRDYQTYVNDPARFTEEQAKRAVQDIVHRLLAAVNKSVQKDGR